MKTAISIPDDLFEAAEVYSRQSRISRSQLYAKAVSEYLKKQQWQKVRESLDAIYAAEDSSPDPVLERMQRFSVSREKW